MALLLFFAPLIFLDNDRCPMAAPAIAARAGRMFGVGQVLSAPNHRVRAFVAVDATHLCFDATPPHFC